MTPRSTRGSWPRRCSPPAPRPGWRTCRTWRSSSAPGAAARAAPSSPTAPWSPAARWCWPADGRRRRWRACRPRLRPAPAMRIAGQPPALIGRTVRGLVHGSPVYLVPREDGELVVGATQEEMGEDTTVTAGAVWQLLRDARALVPGITELELTEAIAGLRPGTPDNAPVLGPSALPGMALATGHFRGGVLLTPVTADLIAQFLHDGKLPPAAAAFTADRFTPRGRA